MQVIEWVEVPVVCNTAKTSQLSDLGIEVKESEYEIRPVMIRISHVFGFYPAHDREHCIVHTFSESLEVCISYEQFKKAINIQQKNANP